MFLCTPMRSAIVGCPTSGIHAGSQPREFRWRVRRPGPAGLGRGSWCPRGRLRVSAQRDRAEAGAPLGRRIVVHGAERTLDHLVLGQSYRAVVRDRRGSLRQPLTSGIRAASQRRRRVWALWSEVRISFACHIACAVLRADRLPGRAALPGGGSSTSGRAAVVGVRHAGSMQGPRQSQQIDREAMAGVGRERTAGSRRIRKRRSAVGP